MIDDLLRFARFAGTLILRSYRRPETRAWTKEDHSPVTEADFASHHYLNDALAGRFGLPIVSEEGELPPRAAAEYFLVDPLDGTRDFLEGNDEFAVCIALIREGVAVAGVIHAPAFHQSFFAEAGKGAYCQTRDEAPIRMPTGKATTELCMVQSRHHHSPLADQFQKANGIPRVLAIGSAIKFGHLAMGQVSVYPRYGNCGEWDIAAGHVILREAGGEVINMKTGLPVVYGQPSFRAPPFIAFAPGFSPCDFKIGT